MNQLLMFDDLDIDYAIATSFNEAMNFFQCTPRTEEAFYLRFQILPVEHLKALIIYYNTNENCKIFTNICKHFNL